MSKSSFKTLLTVWKALRPWSFTASLLPTLIISATISEFSYIKLNCVAFSILCVHCGSNLANTYYDYVNDVDKYNHEENLRENTGNSSSHQDLTIVGNILSAREVSAMFISAYAIGASIAIYLLLLDSNFTLTNIHPTIAAAIIIYWVGCFLGYFYTAFPFSFKYNYLGEVVIFLCFGPLLTQYVGLILTHSVPNELYLYTLPLTFITVAILHAKNSRDKLIDHKVGVATIAEWLGKEQSHRLYRFLILSAYLILFYVVVSHRRYACIITFTTLPRAISLIKAFRCEDFLTVIQGTAHLHLVVGLLYYGGLLIM